MFSEGNESMQHKTFVEIVYLQLCILWKYKHATYNSCRNSISTTVCSEGNESVQHITLVELVYLQLRVLRVMNTQLL